MRQILESGETVEVISRKMFLGSRWATCDAYYILVCFQVRNPTNGKSYVVLLVRHMVGISKYRFRGCRTSRSTEIFR